jgi:N6-adenosine-specific RNA methylase IME4
MEEIIKFEPDDVYGNINQIQLYSGFDAELAVIETLKDIKKIESKVAAIAEFLKKSKAGLDMQNKAGRYLLKIESKKGIWLNENYPQGGKNQYTKQATDNVASKMPISFNESSKARLINANKELTEQVADEIEKEGKVITPSLVSTGIRKVKRAEEIEAIKQKIITENLVITDNVLYDVIAIDPPWNYGGEYDPDNRRVTSPYPEMTTEEISKIQLPLKLDAVVFLWTTQRFIWDAKKIIDIWGLNYQNIIVWDKVKMGIGSTMRIQTEFCLLCTKGKPLLSGSNLRDIITEPRRQHSRKPEAFYKLVETLTIGKKLDYFSREKRNNWDSFGIESNKFKN